MAGFRAAAGMSQHHVERLDQGKGFGPRFLNLQARDDGGLEDGGFDAIRTERLSQKAARLPQPDFEAMGIGGAASGTA